MKNTNLSSTAAAVIDTYNNRIHISIISEDAELNFNLSLTDAVNLLENKATKKSFQIRKNTPDDADKGKPKPAIFGKYLGDNVLRIAMAKTNKEVKKAADLNEAIEYHIENFETLLEAILAHMQNMEKFKEYKLQFFKQYQKTGSGFDI